MVKCCQNENIEDVVTELVQQEKNMDFEYCDEYLTRVVDNRATQDTFLLCHLFSYFWDLKKCHWSLYYTLQSH